MLSSNSAHSHFLRSNIVRVSSPSSADNDGDLDDHRSLSAPSTRHSPVTSLSTSATSLSLFSIHSPLTSPPCSLDHDDKILRSSLSFPSPPCYDSLANDLNDPDIDILDDAPALTRMPSVPPSPTPLRTLAPAPTTDASPSSTPPTLDCLASRMSWPVGVPRSMLGVFRAENWRSEKDKHVFLATAAPPSVHEQAKDCGEDVDGDGPKVYNLRPRPTTSVKRPRTPSVSVDPRSSSTPATPGRVKRRRKDDPSSELQYPSTGPLPMFKYFFQLDPSGWDWWGSRGVNGTEAGDGGRRVEEMAGTVESDGGGIRSPSISLPPLAQPPPRPLEVNAMLSKPPFSQSQSSSSDRSPPIRRPLSAQNPHLRSFSADQHPLDLGTAIVLSHPSGAPPGFDLSSPLTGLPIHQQQPFLSGPGFPGLPLPYPCPPREPHTPFRRLPPPPLHSSMSKLSVTGS